MKSVAFLRAINVSATNKITMADLRQFMADLGFTGVSTLLQTGNVLFDSGDNVDLETQLKAEADVRLGLKTEFFVRSEADIDRIIDENPFPQEALDDPSHLVVLFANQEASVEAQENLRAWIKGPEYFRCVGRNFYFVYPDNIGNSKLTIKVIERHLDCLVTGRNWNTTLKVQASLKSDR